MADDPVLAPAVDGHPRCIDLSQGPAGRANPQQLGRHRADTRIGQPRGRRGQKPRAQEAVGVQQQHEIAVRGPDRLVDHRGIADPYGQPQMPHPASMGQLGGAVARGVVDDHNLGRGQLTQGGRQRVLEHRRLVDAEQQNGRLHNSSR